MRLIAGFFAAVIAVAVLSSLLTWQWIAGRDVATVESRAWLLDELRVTPEQRRTLEPIEARYLERERTLRQQMQQANRELAAAIARSQEASPEVFAAVEKVHRHMGELQKASLEHLFEIRKVLSREQAERLLQLAQQSLEQAP